MKRIIAILFLIVYSSTAFSFSVSEHFCSGIYAGIAIANFGGSVDCGCDHSDHTHKGCCEDKIITAKTDDHKTSQQYVLDISMSEKYSAPFFIIDDIPDFGVSYSDILLHNSHQADLIRSSKPSLNIFLCVYHI